MLGRISLTQRGEPVDRVLAQPKRFGLLVYLALGRPHGFVGRNELLGVFWPDSTEDRAGASLRQALRLAERARSVGAPGRGADHVRWALRLDPTQETTELMVALRDGSEELGASGRRGGPGRLSPCRILVLPLEDLAGDRGGTPALGRLAADVIAQGLAGISELDVVPPMAAMGAAASGPESEAGQGGGVEGSAARGGGLPAATLDLARATGAGTVVGGVVWREEDRVHFQVRCVDLTWGAVGKGRLLESPSAVSAPVSTPGDALEELRNPVVTLLAPALTRRVVHLRPAARPPSVQAYSA